MKSLESKQLQNSEADGFNLSMMSPRNFLRVIANGIDELKSKAYTPPNQPRYSQFLSTFHNYLESFSKEYSSYKQKLIKKQDEPAHERRESMQMEIKMNTIPEQYFQDCASFQLDLGRRNQIYKNQQILSEHLDEIQIIIFSKTKKYPDKSFIILNNMVELENSIHISQEKVTNFRSILKEKIITHQQRVKKIDFLLKKMKNIKQLIELIHTCQKVKNIKDIASGKEKSNKQEQALLCSKKKQIQLCLKIKGLQKIALSIDDYRMSIKQKIYSQFTVEIKSCMQKILSYNKQDWNLMFESAQKRLSAGLNESALNITVLDESCFVFDSQAIEFRHNAKANVLSNNNSWQQTVVLDLNPIYDLWEMILKFDLYDEVEVHEYLDRNLLKHNTLFTHHINQYLAFIAQTNPIHQISQIPEQASKHTSIEAAKKTTKSQPDAKDQQASQLNTIQSYAALQKLKKGTQPAQNYIISSTIQQAHVKLNLLDMKMFVKIITFYFQLLKKFINFLNCNPRLFFFEHFKPKALQFIEHRVQYFVNQKKLSSSTCIEDFQQFLVIFQFWLNEEEYELYDKIEHIRTQVVEQFLTAVQKDLLVKELKNSIENCDFMPIAITSDSYMMFNFVVKGKHHESFNQEVDLSMTMERNTRLESQQGNYPNGQNSKDMNVFRFIDKKIFYNGRSYLGCQPFLRLIQEIHRYFKIAHLLPEFQDNVQEKVCELIGFFTWYNQKIITNPKNPKNTLKNCCIFYSNLLLVKEIFSGFNFVNKKYEKTKIQISQCEGQMEKSINMCAFLHFEQQISQLYQSRISTRLQIPTPESIRIIEYLKESIEFLKKYFPMEQETSLGQCIIGKLMVNSIKLIHKNYFGYLINMEKRGLQELKWFFPRFKQSLEVVTTASQGQVEYLFKTEIQQMENVWKTKSAGK